MWAVSNTYVLPAMTWGSQNKTVNSGIIQKSEKRESSMLEITKRCDKEND